VRRTIVDLTESFAPALTVVPPTRRGVCDLCHGAVQETYARCWSCEQTASAVADPVQLVVPISLCERGGQLHHVLRNYKDNRRPQVRHEFTRLIGAMFARFLDEHARCVELAGSGSWDWITTVPSTTPRPGRRPLEDAVSMVRELAQVHHRTMSPKAGRPERLHPTTEAFDVISDVRDRPILLLDDTFTSGTNIQSAASALHAAGATVTAAVVVGRFINPDYNAPARTLWESVTGRDFDFAKCCLCQR
jgi:predicted amidophosphoribosyltransferase